MGEAIIRNAVHFNDLYNFEMEVEFYFLIFSNVVLFAMLFLFTRFHKICCNLKIKSDSLAGKNLIV